MLQIKASDIAKMPIGKRIQLVEDLWDSIIELPEPIELPDWHKEELEKRLEEYHKNPGKGSPWLEVKKRILK